MTQVDIRHVVDLVYGEHVDRPSGEELMAARRVLERPGMTTDKVRLMLIIVGSSPRFWGPMFDTACARGYGVRRLEEQLKGLDLAVARDPSAPGNRAADAAYNPLPRTPEQEAEHEAIVSQIEMTQTEKVHAVQQPWRDLIAEAESRGLTGPAMSRWVFREYERRTGKTGIAVIANRMLDSLVLKAGTGTPVFDPPKAPREPAYDDEPMPGEEP